MSGFIFISGRRDALSVAEKAVDCLKLPSTCNVSTKETISLNKATAFSSYWKTNIPLQRQAVTLDQNYTIIIDGEIYSDDGLHKNVHHHLLELFKKGQHEEIVSLNGSFIIAIYNNIQNEINLYADRLGTRSTYFAQVNGGFTVASKLQAILCDDRIKPMLSSNSYIELFSHQRTFNNNTVYKTISTLEGGDHAVISPHKKVIHQRNKLRWSPTSLSKEEISEQIASTMIKAVHRRIASPGKKALFMSGGLDSRAILSASVKAGNTLPCLSLAPWENDEIKLARRVSQQAKTIFKFKPIRIEELTANLKTYTLATDGLFPGPGNLYSAYQDISKECDIIFSGHALDVLFRGILLPKHYARLGRSKTALPILDNSPCCNSIDVFSRTKVQIPQHSRALAIKNSVKKRWNDHLQATAEAVEKRIDTGEEHANVFDALALHSLCRYNTNSDYYSMAPHMEFRNLAHDAELLDVYLSMPAAWRVGKSTMVNAMTLLSPALMALPDANTMLRADMGPYHQIAFTYLRAAARKLHLIADPRRIGMGLNTGGSWMSWSQFFRKTNEGQLLMSRIADLESYMGLGLFDADGLRKIIKQHQEGDVDHTKFIMQSLSTIEWITR
ncbi:asparagine synthase-related protein [Kiloniella litopenaei]|uniref:asparagine synthase-related protein n=1 Tax=Kiloniella litopenaei TaxID=1549748 RepID=UPI003BAD4333